MRLESTTCKHFVKKFAYMYGYDEDKLYHLIEDHLGKSAGDRLDREEWDYMKIVIREVRM